MTKILIELKQIKSKQNRYDDRSLFCGEAETPEYVQKTQMPKIGECRLEHLD